MKRMIVMFLGAAFWLCLCPGCDLNAKREPHHEPPPPTFEELRLLGDFLPFGSWELDAASGLMRLQGEDGGALPVPAFPQPFVAHSPRFTGHLHGQLAGVWTAFFDFDGSLVEALGGGLLGTKTAELEKRMPWYEAPAAATVTSMRMYDAPGSTVPYDWTIGIKLPGCENVAVGIGHVITLDEAFMDAAVAAGNPDPRAWTSSSAPGFPGAELVRNPFPVAKGARIGRAGLYHMIDCLLADHPDYLDRNGAVQPTQTSLELWRVDCANAPIQYNPYAFLPDSVKSRIVAVSVAALNNPDLYNARNRG
jgi:hypothetical protein